MPKTYQRDFRVRSYECDAYGHVNNAVYLHYMQEAALEASGDAGYDMAAYDRLGQFWLIRETDIEYIHPLRYGDTVGVQTWVEDFRRVRSRRHYVFKNGDAIVARAATDWVYLDRQTLRPAPVPEEMVRAFAPERAGGSRAAREPFPEAPPPPAGMHRMERRVAWRDIDSVGHVNNAVYLAYIEEAGIDVARARGWPMSRMMEMGFGILARRHRIEYRLPAVLGDDLSIETWLSPPKRSSVVRHYVIRRGREGEDLVRARTVWVWVDLNTGRPIRIPANFIKDFESNVAR